MVTPNDLEKPCEDTLNITNSNGNNATVTLLYQLSISTKMIHLTISNVDYYYDYYSTKSQLHYFDSTYQDIGNTLNGDANTQYDN